MFSWLIKYKNWVKSKTITNDQKENGGKLEKKIIIMIDHQKCIFSFSTLLTPLGLHKYLLVLGDWKKTKAMMLLDTDRVPKQLQLLANYYI